MKREHRTSNTEHRTSNEGKLKSSLAVGANTGELRFGSLTVNLSNLNKVLYPQTGFTKGEMIAYYVGMADTLLPHLKGRKLTRKRYPDGVDKPFFLEKNCPSYRPEWVATSRVAGGKRGNVDYCVAENKATLAWLANLAAIEFHTLLSKGDDTTRPTSVVFDLDPGAPAGMLDCIRIGVRLRDMLAGFGLESFAKTSGGKGLHLYVPLNTPAVTFEQTKSFANAVARVLEKDDPKTVIAAMKRDLRGGKVFVDWSQNDEHKTTCCVYSLRARERPTVSTPVTWDELASAAKRKNPDSLVFEAPDVLKRLKRTGDLFAPVLKLKQKLPAR